MKSCVTSFLLRVVFSLLKPSSSDLKRKVCFNVPLEMNIGVILRTGSSNFYWQWRSVAPLVHALYSGLVGCATYRPHWFGKRITREEQQLRAKLFLQVIDCTWTGEPNIQPRHFRQASSNYSAFYSCHVRLENPEPVIICVTKPSWNVLSIHTRVYENIRIALKPWPL
jgi:hypothetical protein